MSTTTEARPSAAPTPSRRRLRYAGAVVALAAVASAGILLGRGGTPPPVDLSLGGGGVMASCIPVSADLLADMPVAFEGTVTALEDDLVTMSVDRWFRGGESAEARLHAITDMEIMVSPIDFQVGSRYLITATDGKVNYCGFSGPSTPQLRDLFEQAFGG